MGRFIWSQLRHRTGRAAALLVGILVATTSFTVLTSTAQTSQLRTTGTVGAHFRASYDVLVRPPGSQTQTEAQNATVQPNFLAGIYGGITADQWRRIQQIPGVDVAAPIAMVGTALPKTYLPVPLGRHLTGSDRQMFRIRSTWVSDRGLTRVSEPESLVYVTSHELTSIDTLAADGALATEAAGGDKQVRTCPGSTRPHAGRADPFGAAARARLACWSRRTGLAGNGAFGSLTAADPGYPLAWSVPLLIAAVDPVAEAQLGALDSAVVSGRYLQAHEPAGPPAEGSREFPVLVSAHSGVDSTVQVQVQRLPDPTAPPPLLEAEQLAGRYPDPGATIATTTFTAQQAYQQLLDQLLGETNKDLFQGLDGYWEPGPVNYQTAADGGLAPTPQPRDASVWASAFQFTGTFTAPMDNRDTGFRALRQHPWGDTHRPAAAPRAVGVFDPRKLPPFDPLSEVNLGLYTPVTVPGADPPSRAALSGQPLAPSGNLAGYLRQPPQLITTLDALPALHGPAYGNATHAAAPISVIRVRVTGVDGPDPVSRERVNQVAQQIAVQTGLQVDLVVGSSPSPTQVRLPAGAHGRPELLLSEGWVKKNVTVTILSAVNRKSLLLFGLILAVCALFVANGTSAAVRTRRTELGVLSCLGWSTRRLFTVVLGEVLAVGTLAGLLGAALAVPLGRSLGLPVSPPRAALAVPAAVTLALLAGAIPAWRASRADPGAAVRPAVHTSWRARGPRGLLGLALNNVLRTPGRSAAAVLSLAVGVAALTLLVGITLAFRGVVVGSLLGDAVAVQIRGVDFLAVAVTVALGVVAVADVLFLNVRERAGELATLRATGWTERALSQLVLLEGAVLGAAGATLGAALGLTGAAVFTDVLPPALLASALVVLLAGVAVTALSALVPAQLLRRLPTAPLLAEE